MISGDTIAAIATAPGRGGVAIVRVSGREAFSVAERLTGMRDELRGMSVRRVYSRSDPRSLIPDPCEAFGYAERLAPAHPHNSDATAPGRGGDRGYGITGDHLNERKNFRISSAVWQAARRL